MGKSVMLTYALWVVGGPFGLHHLYLGRDNHALLWMLTLGGFGFGWIREFLRIPAYVREANQDSVEDRRRPTNLPPLHPVRFIGQACVGIYFGTVAMIGLNSLSFFYLIVLPISVAVGVHLVSNVGQQTSDLQKTLTACLVTSSLLYGSAFAPLPISLAATVTAAQHRRFKPPRSPRSTQTLAPRLFRLTLALVAFSAPLGFCIFHNTTATLYYLSDCIAALLDFFWFVPWLRHMLESILLMPYRILCAVTGGGYYEETWRKVLEILLREYTEREKDALRVLSLHTDASLEEINQGYRKLVKIWHPDHNPSTEAEDVFLKIQQAYELLQRWHRPRHSK
ncbi:dnaJ homolog subfamily C member 22 [Gouania willdenowi]|uniref:DnaJ homolog subfamily C member 22 n=1 Tax=Gouania willdenowi TaxID=441366 RepID=A0A8C5GQ12_GOUWI|nr:dnaJ homolog subfamily C member 22 [Gouania willdenowi]XP_028308754.1 dnaJ homolog subfamily C member 22 [Gouania willdenowi]